MKNSMNAGAVKKILRTGLAIAFGVAWGGVHAYALDVPDDVKAKLDEIAALDWGNADAAWNTALSGEYVSSADGVLGTVPYLSSYGSYGSFVGNGDLTSSPPGSVSSGNMIDVDDTSTDLTGNVYGGLVSGAIGDSTGNASADGNRVRIKKEQQLAGVAATTIPNRNNASASVYGGAVTAGEGGASNNIVLVEKGAVIGSNYDPNASDGYSGLPDAGGVYGGYTYNTVSPSGLANNNAVVIQGGIINKKEIIGGCTSLSASVPGTSYGSGSANGNIVAIMVDDNSSFTFAGKEIIGGHSYSSHFDNNTVYITGSQSTLNFTNSSGVQIIGGRKGIRHAMYVESGSYNTVVIDITGDSGTPAPSGIIEVTGAFTYHGDVANNKVIISGKDAWINQNGVRGAYCTGSNGSVTNNTVIITDATVECDPSLNSNAVVGGRGGNDVNDNKVWLTNANVLAGSVVGGRSEQTGGRGTAADNEVHVSGGTIAGDVLGAISEQSSSGNSVEIKDSAIVTGAVKGGESTGARVTSYTKFNTVSIVNSTVNGDVIGGDVGGASPVPGAASDNTIAIENAVITGSIIGGRLDTTGSLTSLESRDNIIRISGKNTFSGTTTRIMGGNVESSGNRLETNRADGLTVDTVGNFQYYTFTIGGEQIGRSVYIINGAPVDLQDTTNVDLALDAGTSVFDAGDQVTLFSKTTNSGNYDSFSYTINSILFHYDGEYFLGDAADRPLNFRITSRTQNDENRTYGQAQLAGLQMANIASDFARSISMLYDAASEVIECDTVRSGGPALFAGFNGGASRWNTDGASRTQLQHTSLLAGLGWRTGNLLLAGYFESGWGKYDAKLNGRTLVDGDKTDYIGGGVLARYDTGTFYAESGFHAGRLKTDFDGKFELAQKPSRVRYDTSAAYYGVDAVLGYRLEAGRSTIDLSGRYSWNRVSGDDFMIEALSASQDAVDSHRVRVGAEWSLDTGMVTPYAGAYYEHEFGATSGIRVGGASLLEASMRGSSGIGELGIRFGGGDARLSADLGVEGYVGKRQGVAGKLQVGYSF